MPPVSAEMVCNSPPFARATSAAASARRRLEEALGIVLLIVDRISDEVAEGM